MTTLFQNLIARVGTRRMENRHARSALGETDPILLVNRLVNSARDANYGTRADRLAIA